MLFCHAFNPRSDFMGSIQIAQAKHDPRVYISPAESQCSDQAWRSRACWRVFAEPSTIGRLK